MVAHRREERKNHTHPWSGNPSLDRKVPARAGVDPTFGQPVADATHLKLVEGESISDLLPLLDWVGKVRIDVLEPG